MWVNNPAAVLTRKQISVSYGMANVTKPFILEFPNPLYVDRVSQESRLSSTELQLERVGGHAWSLQISR